MPRGPHARSQTAICARLRAPGHGDHLASAWSRQQGHSQGLREGGCRDNDACPALPCSALGPFPRICPCARSACEAPAESPPWEAWPLRLGAAPAKGSWFLPERPSKAPRFLPVQATY